jgi:hypothetical protein
VLGGLVRCNQSWPLALREVAGENQCSCRRALEISRGMPGCFRTDRTLRNPGSRPAALSGITSLRTVGSRRALCCTLPPRTAASDRSGRGLAALLCRFPPHRAFTARASVLSQLRRAYSCLTVRPSRNRFAVRLNSGVRPRQTLHWCQLALRLKRRHSSIRASAGWGCSADIGQLGSGGRVSLSPPAGSAATLPQKACNHVVGRCLTIRPSRTRFVASLKGPRAQATSLRQHPAAGRLNSGVRPRQTQHWFQLALRLQRRRVLPCTSAGPGCFEGLRPLGSGNSVSLSPPDRSAVTLPRKACSPWLSLPNNSSKPTPLCSFVERSGRSAT